MSALPEFLEVRARDDVRLHAQRLQGGEPALLLLHGFTGSTESWCEVIGAIVTLHPATRRPTFLTVDLPGHGKSSALEDPRSYDLERLADHLTLVLDAARTERVVVLGYSLGGRAALRLALRHPQRVRGLILESTSPGIEDDAERETRRRNDEELADYILRQGMEAFVDRWERLPLWASQTRLDARRRGKLRQQRLSQSPMGLANSLRGAGAGRDVPVLDRLGEIPVPVLLIAGELDPRYVDHARGMASRLRAARVAIVPGAGHAVHVERPTEYARIVSAFLDSFSRMPDPPIPCR